MLRLLTAQCHLWRKTSLGYCMTQVIRASSTESTSPGESITEMPEAFEVLKDASKIRINQVKLQRIGVKPAYLLSIRDFDIVNTETDVKILFIRVFHAMAVEKYRMSIYSSNPDERKEEAANPCIGEVFLDRNHILRTIAARVYAPPGEVIGYIYDLEGVYRTAIIENGEGKCVYQLHTKDPSGWLTQAKIYSATGSRYLGYLKKLDTVHGHKRHSTTVYMRLRDNTSHISCKCCMIAAVIYLVFQFSFLTVIIIFIALKLMKVKSL